MKIRDEREFLAFARRRAELDELVLRAQRMPAHTLNNFLLAECQWHELEDQRGDVQTAMDAYDAEHNADRKGAWMPIGPRSRFWPEDPRPHDFDITDIARSLARINRFNGRIRFDHYSVAQHSVLTAGILPEKYRLFGLMHDAAEAYLGDVITPIKRLFREFYEGVEERVMRAIAERFRFLDVFDDEQARVLVKRADTVMLATEARDVTVLGFVSQRLTELPLEKRIESPWAPTGAERAFLSTFRGLTSGARAVA